jgi:hypothetical protein
MSWILLAAGTYHLSFAVWANAWPHLWFDWSGLERLNHPMLWRGIGLMEGALGVGFLLIARAPLRHWPVVGIGLAKFTLVAAGFFAAFQDGTLPARSLWLVVVDDLIWWPPFAVILLAALRSHFEVPQRSGRALTVSEAAREFRLSTGESLMEAAADRMLTIVFLRHFGCTFTRQILRGLKTLEHQADHHGARLVLVHMLRSGDEARYIAENGQVARIADPGCELYRAFGLGKGDLIGLLGPRVLLRGAISLFKGCGVGHLAGDGLQMPGVFIFQNDGIVAAQRARSASDLPDLPRLFQGLPSASGHASVLP